MVVRRDRQGRRFFNRPAGSCLRSRGDHVDRLRSLPELQPCHAGYRVKVLRRQRFNDTDSRIFHSGNLLASGQVLIAGGSQIAGTLDSAEIYDPATGIFTATAGAMSQARYHHTSTLLSDNTVLITGGDNGGGLLVATALISAELYDPTTNKFTSPGDMFSPRTWHTATKLQDGKVLIAGGSPAVDSAIDPTTGTGTGTPIGALPSAELYEPASKQFAGNPGAMNDARTEHAAAFIKGCGCTAENEVLLAGGIDASGTTLTSAELFKESDNSFTVTGSMNVARHNHTATTLKDGRVLITGGVDNSINVRKWIARRYSIPRAASSRSRRR